MQTKKTPISNFKEGSIVLMWGEGSTGWDEKSQPKKPMVILEMYEKKHTYLHDTGKQKTKT